MQLLLVGVLRRPDRDDDRRHPELDLHPGVREHHRGADRSTLHNADDTPHTFTVKGTDVDVKIEGGQTAEASLAGVAAGTYAVSCLYHPQMTESLQVT